MTINFISFKDSDEIGTIHTKRNNIKNLLHYNLRKRSLNRGGSYIDSPKWLKNKNKTINPKNNDDKCFQYVVTVVLNYQNIKSSPERISK